MNLKEWVSAVISVGLPVIALLMALDKFVHTRVNEDLDAKRRLDILEKKMDKIEAKASSDAGKWQQFIGRIEIHMALVRNKLKIREPFD